MFINDAKERMHTSLKRARKAAGPLRVAAGIAIMASTFGSTPASAEEQWSLTLIKHANKGAEAYNNGDFARAREEYRTAIGLSPKSPELYESLLYTCTKSKEWDQVAFASEKLLELEPSKKNEIAYDYSQALYNLNRYEDALPWLKRALTTIEAPEVTFKPKIHSEDIVPEEKKVAYVPPPVVVAPPPPPREKIIPSQYIRSFENAIHAESIVVAKYLGYEKGDIHFNSPPQANYTITKFIKGPPLNRSLPVRYEFHDNVQTTVPPGWKFGPDVMPKKDSEWILFIEFAVPKKGMFETFQGSYGRQPATDENLNEVYGLIEKHNMGIPSTR